MGYSIPGSVVRETSPAEKPYTLSPVQKEKSQNNTVNQGVSPGVTLRAMDRGSLTGTGVTGKWL